MSRIEKLIEFIETSGKDSFLQHALALEYLYPQLQIQL